MTYQEILYHYREYFELDHFITNPIRQLGFWIIQWLMRAVSSIQSVFVEVLDFSNIIDSGQLKELLDTFSSSAFIIGAVSLTIYGIRYILDDGLRLKSIVDHVLLGIGVTLMSGIVISHLVVLSVDITKELATNESSGNNTSMVYNVVNHHIIDLYAMFENDFDIEQSHTHLNEDTISFMDISETLNPKFIHNEEAKKAVEYTIQLTPDGEGWKVEKLNDFWLFGIERHYYRYSWSFWSLFAYLFTSVFVYVLASIKSIQLFIEILFTQTLLPLFSFSNLQTGKTLKKVMENIKNACIALVLIGLVLKTYTITQLYLSEHSFSPGTAFLIQLGLSIAVIDGPAIVQQLTGYDAGVKSMARTVIGGAAAGYTATRTATRTASQGVQKGWQATKFVGSGAKQMVQKGIESLTGKQGVSSSDERASSVRDKVNQYMSAVSKKTGSSSDTPSTGGVTKGTSIRKDGREASVKNEDGASKQPLRTANEPVATQKNDGISSIQGDKTSWKETPNGTLNQASSPQSDLSDASVQPKSADHSTHLDRSSGSISTTSDLSTQNKSSIDSSSTMRHSKVQHDTNRSQDNADMYSTTGQLKNQSADSSKQHRTGKNDAVHTDKGGHTWQQDD